MPVITLLAKHTNVAKFSFQLRRHYHLKFLKLLHVHHNLDHLHFTDTDDADKQRMLFVRLSPLGLAQYESITDDDTVGSHSYIAIGSTLNSAEGAVVSRDLYKVLVDKAGFMLNQDIKMVVFYQDHAGAFKPLEGNYDFVNKKDTHKNKAFINLVLEYEEI